MTRWAKLLVVAGAVLVLLTCLGIAPEFLLLVPFTFAFGWVAYLRRVLPHVHLAWPAVVSAVACLAGTIALGHAFARWLWRETGPAPATAARPPWRFRWTLAATAVAVLMFTAGIAAVGVTHQSAWLAGSGARLLEMRGGPRRDKVRCMSNLCQIGVALEEYAKSNDGRYPDSLAQLLVPVDVTAELFVCPATVTNQAPGATPQEQARQLLPDHCDYVYHGRGLRQPLLAMRPIVCEPLTNHDLAGMNILYGDGHVEWHTPAEAQRVMGSLPSTPP